MQTPDDTWLESDPTVWLGVVHEPTAERPVSMDWKIKELWCDALESGDYKQNHIGVLRTADDEFDPFGVLVDIASKMKVVSWDRIGSEWMAYGHTRSIPSPVREWAGIKGCHPSQDVVVEWGGSFHPLYRLNDHYKMSFDVISHLVRMQY